MAKFSEIQLRDTCGDLKARKIIKAKCDRYSYARILGFHTEDGKDYVYDYNNSHNAMQNVLNHLIKNKMITLGK